MADGPVTGRTAIRENEAALFAMFEDVKVEVRATAASGSVVLLEVVLRATNTGPLDVGAPEPVPATNRRVEIPAMWVLQVG